MSETIFIILALLAPPVGFGIGCLILSVCDFLDKAKENKQSKINNLDSFFIENPFRYKVRKIMTRFLQGIGATVLSIIIVSVLISGISKSAEHIRARNAFEDTHFNVYVECTNCGRGQHPDFEKGKTVQDSTYECLDCGMVGKLNRIQDTSYVYYNIERIK